MAQNDTYALILRKLPKGKRIQYEVADPIMFSYKDTILLDTIKSIDSSRVQLNNNHWYEISKIQMVCDIKGRSFFRNGAVEFPVAGVLFFSLTTLNQGLNHGKPLILREHLIPSSVLVAAGALMFPFRHQHYNLKRRWELITVPI